MIHCVLHDSGDAAAVPVAGFGIELHGDHDTIMRASKTAKEYVKEWKGTNYPDAEHVLGPKAKVDSDYPLY